MSGFFTKTEVISKSRPDGRILSCISCGKYKDSFTPKMKPYGQFKKKILVIGRNPERSDDRQGTPFQGIAGKLLQESFKELGISLFNDCLTTFACFCRGTNDDAPSKYEIDCCRKSILKIIEEKQPQLIILLGNSALYSIIGHRWKKDLGNIDKWRGWTIPDQDFKCWICPIHSPQSIVTDKREVAMTIWKQDLERAFNQIEVKFPKHIGPLIEYLEDDLMVLDTIKEGMIAFDYETTGLKPQNFGHKIVCASVAYERNKVYTFMMPERLGYRKPFLRLLANPNIKKVAQNMKFEDTWSNIILHQEVNGWHWDPMLASHLLDNRPAITNLKFQTYIQFGIVDYSSEIEPHLKSVDGKANGFNKVLKLIATPKGKQSLLKYCALDSIYEYRLAELQQNIII